MKILKFVLVGAWIVALGGALGWCAGNAANDHLFSRDPSGYSRYWNEWLPFWGLYAGLTVSAALLIPLALRARRQSRRLAVRCPSCGYDLRGSPGDCPECGARTNGIAGRLGSTRRPSSSPPAQPPILTMFADGRIDPLVPLGTAVILFQNGVAEVGRLEEGPNPTDGGPFIGHPLNGEELKAEALSLVRQTHPGLDSFERSFVLVCPAELASKAAWP